jgi:hypothetical protein
MRFTLILQAFSLVLPVVSGAQTVAASGWPPASGSRARILSPVLGDQQQTITVTAATPDTLFFRQSGHTSDLSLGTSQITRMEIPRGSHTQRRKGALIGLLVGAAIGGATAAATYERPEGFSIDFGRAGTAALGAGFAGIVGALIGTLAGARPVDTWVPIDVPRAGALGH